MVIYILYIFSRLLAVPRAGCRKSYFFFIIFYLRGLRFDCIFHGGAVRSCILLQSRDIRHNKKKIKKIQQELPYIRYINILRQDFFYIIYFFFRFFCCCWNFCGVSANIIIYYFIFSHIFCAPLARIL